MKIVCVSGSPRKGENSERIVEKARAYFAGSRWAVEKILLSEVETAPCIHCNYCKTKPSCNQDEEANRVNGILAGADALLVVTPVYFGGVAGQLKCLFDKTLPLRRDGMRLKGKIGAAIAVGNSRNGGQELAVKDIHAWMLIHGMVLVGDNSHFGGTVQAPFEDDSTGGETVQGTLEAMKSLLSRVGEARGPRGSDE
jgi:multimeric flavodoxin WrbA